MIERKIQLVYLHWAIIPIFLALLLLGLRHLNRKGKSTRIVLSRTTVAFLTVYSLVGGFLPFFNKVGFHHHMLYWNLFDHIPYMLYSLGIAFIPLLLVFIIRCLKAKSFNVGGDILLTLFPFVHTTMAVVYVFLAPYAIE